MQEERGVSWLLVLGLAVVLTEAIVEISVDSALFDKWRRAFGGSPLRERGEDDRPSLGEVFVWCGYCQSFWVGMGFSFLLGLKLPELPPPWPVWVEWPAWAQSVLMGLVAHRLSNVWHDGMGWLRNRVHPFVG